MLPKLFVLIFVLLVMYVTPQSKYKVFRIIDSENGSSIPYPTIAFVRENFVGNGDEDGKVTLPETISESDSIIISKQGYLTYKTIVSAFKTANKISLTKKNIILKASSIALSKAKNTSILNKYDSDQVFYFVGLEKSTEHFNFLQVAQKFTSPNKGSLLKEVVVSRLILSEDVIDDNTRLTRTNFKIRVYDADSATSGPGEDLCHQEIIVENLGSKDIKIDLTGYKIFLPNKTFFVAIEWLRIPLNAQAAISKPDGSIYHGPRLEINNLNVMYQPFVGMSRLRGTEINTWALDLQSRWTEYTHFLPDLTDFAISATVKF